MNTTYSRIKVWVKYLLPGLFSFTMFGLMGIWLIDISDLLSHIAPIQGYIGGVIILTTSIISIIYILIKGLTISPDKLHQNAVKFWANEDFATKNVISSNTKQDAQITKIILKNPLIGLIYILAALILFPTIFGTFFIGEVILLKLIIDSSLGTILSALAYIVLLVILITSIRFSVQFTTITASLFAGQLLRARLLNQRFQIKQVIDNFLVAIHFHNRAKSLRPYSLTSLTKSIQKDVLRFLHIKKPNSLLAKLIILILEFLPHRNPEYSTYEACYYHNIGHIALTNHPASYSYTEAKKTTPNDLTNLSYILSRGGELPLALMILTAIIVITLPANKIVFIILGLLIIIFAVSRYISQQVSLLSYIVKKEFKVNLAKSHAKHS